MHIQRMFTILRVVECLIANVHNLAKQLIDIACVAHRTGGSDAAAFASGQQFTFMVLIPVLAVSVLVSLLGRQKKPETDESKAKVVSTR